MNTRKPPIPITDPKFVYVPSHRTDIRETFRLARARMAAEQVTNVKPMRKREGK